MPRLEGEPAELLFGDEEILDFDLRLEFKELIERINSPEFRVLAGLPERKPGNFRSTRNKVTRILKPDENVRDATQQAIPDLNHKHRWLIESPNGPTSDGVCKGCGIHKDFRNSIPDSDYVNSRR